MLLYDVTCEKSFLNIREWVDMIEVKQYRPQLYGYHLTHFEVRCPGIRNMYNIVIWLSVSTVTLAAFVLSKDI